MNQKGTITMISSTHIFSTWLSNHYWTEKLNLVSDEERFSEHTHTHSQWYFSHVQQNKHSQQKKLQDKCDEFKFPSIPDLKKGRFKNDLQRVNRLDSLH